MVVTITFLLLSSRSFRVDWVILVKWFSGFMIQELVNLAVVLKLIPKHKKCI